MNVLSFIMEKIREKPDVTKPVAIESNMAEREKQVLFSVQTLLQYFTVQIVIFCTPLPPLERLFGGTCFLFLEKVVANP